MKKISFAIALAVIIASISAGCSSNAVMPLAPAGDSEAQSNATPTADPASGIDETEDVDSTADPFEDGWEDDGEQPPTTSTFDDSVNPLLVYLGDREAFPPPPFDVDVDFTELDGGGFAEAYSNFLGWDYDPVGKTLRVVGQYSGFYEEEEGKYYHFVILDTDLEGCCIRYFEFDFSEGNDPGEYPEDFTIIDVAGVFSEYYNEEYEWTFQHLIVDGVTVL